MSRPCQNPTCRAAVEGSDRRLYCGKRCQQAHRNARRPSSRVTRPDRKCARAACGQTFEPMAWHQHYCRSECRLAALAERRLAPNTPRHQLVRQLSEEAAAMLERIHTFLRDHGPRDTTAIAALVGRPTQSVVRVLNAAVAQGHIVRRGLEWSLPAETTTATSAPRNGVTIEDRLERGVLLLTRHRPGMPSYTVCLSRQATPEQIAATRTRLESM